MIVKSCYKIAQLVAVIFSFLFFTTIPVFLYLTTPQNNIVMLVIIGMFAWGLYFPYIYLKRSPRIILDSNFISVNYPFGSETYDWTSVQDVFLSNKEIFSVLFMGQSLEATTIVFTNGDKLVLWENMYRNLGEMRDFISQNSVGKIRDPVPDISPKNLHSVTRRRYSGNVYTSLNTLTILGAALFFAFQLRNNLKLDSILLIPVSLIFALFILLGTQMNYFIIDEGYLIIKNHYFPWVNKKINLSDIEGLDIETPYRRSSGLRVISKNFRSKLYGAGTLRTENWEALKKDIKFIGIPVRDDR